MADIKIPQLGSSAGVAGTDYFVVDDGASTVKASGTQVKQFTLGGNKINNLQNLIDNAIAPTEKTPSEHPYSVGDQLIYNDTLYDVTAAISIGDVLTVGTNITAAPNLDDKVKDKADKDIVSDAWDPDSFEYSAGDYAIYQNKLYKCKLTHTSSLSILPTNTTYWDDTTIGAEISACNSNYTKITNFSHRTEIATSSTTTETIKTIPDINNYQYLFILEYSGATLFFGQYIPVGVFKLCQVFSIYDGNANAQVLYVDSTHLKIKSAYDGRILSVEGIN
jgi:hypothetical protein